jgi:hypothetical protein
LCTQIFIIFEVLHDIYSSANIIRTTKSRRKSLAGHVARMGDSCVKYLLEIDDLEDRRIWDDNIKTDV